MTHPSAPDDSIRVDPAGRMLPDDKDVVGPGTIYTDGTPVLRNLFLVISGTRENYRYRSWAIREAETYQEAAEAASPGPHDPDERVWVYLLGPVGVDGMLRAGSMLGRGHISDGWYLGPKKGWEEVPFNA